jgi:hypothetical protein
MQSLGLLPVNLNPQAGARQRVRLMRVTGLPVEQAFELDLVPDRHAAMPGERDFWLQAAGLSDGIAVHRAPAPAASRAPSPLAQ